jgi:hypothetical protein
MLSGLKINNKKLQENIIQLQVTSNKKVDILNLVGMTHFWNNLHQNQKIGKPKNIKVFRSKENQKILTG